MPQSLEGSGLFDFCNAEGRGLLRRGKLRGMRTGCFAASRRRCSRWRGAAVFLDWLWAVWQNGGKRGLEKNAVIRKMQKTERDRVAEIWLEGNIAAHDFIPAHYWERNFEFVKKALTQAEVYVYEEDAAIQGFIGLSGAYIEGIFVCAENNRRAWASVCWILSKGEKTNCA